MPVEFLYPGKHDSLEQREEGSIVNRPGSKNRNSKREPAWPLASDYTPPSLDEMPFVDSADNTNSTGASLTIDPIAAVVPSAVVPSAVATSAFADSAVAHSVDENELDGTEIRDNKMSGARSEPMNNNHDIANQDIANLDVRDIDVADQDMGTQNVSLDESDQSDGTETQSEATQSVATSSGDVETPNGADEELTRKLHTKHPHTRKSFAQTVREYLTLAIMAIVLASIVRAFLGQAYWIPSASMVPTLKIGDRVIVSRVNYKLGTPERGDIVVFQNPDYKPPLLNPISEMGHNVLELVGLGQPKDKYYIKRVMGLPGETLEIKQNHVWINGKSLAEPYLVSGVETVIGGGSYGGKAVVLNKEQYFMMGDNRTESQDSRFFGPIKRKAMIGRMVYRVWPPSRIGMPD